MWLEKHSKLTVENRAKFIVKKYSVKACCVQYEIIKKLYEYNIKSDYENEVLKTVNKLIIKTIKN